MGRIRSKFLVVKEDVREDIVKSILETPDGDLAKALQEAGLEGEGAEALVGAAKVLKAYKDALPEDAIALLAKCTGLALPSHEEGYAERGRKGRRGRERRRRKGRPEAICPRKPWRNWIQAFDLCWRKPWRRGIRPQPRQTRPYPWPRS